MKTILLQTTNLKKLNEFQLFFNHYGIAVIQTSDISEFDSTIHYCFMEEETKLLGNGLKELIDFKDLDFVSTSSTLKYSFDGKTFFRFCSKLVYGFIDISKKNNSEEVFGWDDVFINYHTGLSLYELSKINAKVIGRRENLASFAKQYLYYDKRLDLNFNSFDREETILLDDSVYQFIKNNKYLNSPNVLNSGIHNLLNTMLYNGAFFRKSQNRREKNYWLPGLNAGIPLVAKKDPIHEITFAVHDFMHFLIPDLIYSGNNNDINKQIYVFSRMMSEAISLVLADGWFIQNLSKDFSYDWNKRNIYSLFNNLDLNNKSVLSKCLLNMINYVLKGEDSYLYNITDNKEAVNNFKYKYDSFFVEDYKWTLKNWDNMVSQSESFEKWSSYSHLINDNLLLIDDIAEELITINNIPSKDNIIDFISDVYINKILDSLNSKDSFNLENSLISSFNNYMYGQMFIFEKYNFLNISSIYKNKILNYLINLNSLDFYNIKNFYNKYIEELYKNNLIDYDDSLVYKEIFPLFSPVYVFYDKEKSYYNSINSYYKNI